MIGRLLLNYAGYFKGWVNNVLRGLFRYNFRLNFTTLDLPMLAYWLTALFLSGTAHAAPTVPEAIQTEIVQLYTHENCFEARKLMAHIDLNQLRPNVMAVAAYCEPLGMDPETLFLRAETLNPTGDLILVLHARYRSLNDPKGAAPIWEKVLMTARNTYFRELAKEQLTGVTEDPKKVRPLNLSPTTFLGQAYFGWIFQRNPELQELAFETPKETTGLTLGGLGVYRKWYSFGSLAFRDMINYTKFTDEPNYNYFNNFFEAPLAVHLVTSKDLVFRPFLNYSNLGGLPYHFIYGLGMKAAVYTGSHVQSVQAILFNDRIYHSALTPTQGAHYRFEFAWDFYPLYWMISTLFGVEHLSSARVSNFIGQIGRFEMSHNDLFFNFKFEREFSRFGLEFSPRMTFRMDTDDSRYTSKDGSATTKRRQDLELAIKTTLSAPLIPSVQLFAWHEWDNTFSNFGPNDFADFNYHNQIVGVGLRANFSTY